MGNRIRTSEAAKILGVTTQSVRTFILQGKLSKPLEIHPRLWLLDEGEVLKLRATRDAAQGVTAPTPTEPTPEPTKPVTEAPVSSQGKWSR